MFLRNMKAGHHNGENRRGKGEIVHLIVSQGANRLQEGGMARYNSKNTTQFSTAPN